MAKAPLVFPETMANERACPASGSEATTMPTVVLLAEFRVRALGTAAWRANQSQANHSRANLSRNEKRTIGSSRAKELQPNSLAIERSRNRRGATESHQNVGLRVANFSREFRSRKRATPTANGQLHEIFIEGVGLARWHWWNERKSHSGECGTVAQVRRQFIALLEHPPAGKPPRTRTPRWRSLENATRSRSGFRRRDAAGG